MLTARTVQDAEQPASAPKPQTARARAHARLRQAITKMTQREEFDDLMTRHYHEDAQTTLLGYDVLKRMVSQDLNDLRIIIPYIKDIDEQDQTNEFTVGYTALHWATDPNDQEQYNLLVSTGASESIQNGRGYTPLEKLQSIKAWKANGYNTYCPPEEKPDELNIWLTKKYSFTPGCLNGKLTDESNKIFTNALGCAADEANLPILKKLVAALIQKGVLPEDIIFYLKNADVLLKSVALNRTASDKGDFSCYFFLLDLLEGIEGGADLIAHQDGDGKTAEDYFIEYHEKYLGELQKAALPARQRREAKRAALATPAASTPHPTPTTQVPPADVDKKYYEKALLKAALDGNLEELKKCVADVKRVNGNINALGMEQDTALHYAACHKKNAVACYVYLRDNGADEGAKNGSNLTAWNYLSGEQQQDTLSPDRQNDNAWIATLALKFREEETIRQIKTTLTQLRADIAEEKDKEEHETIRAAARHKIAWLIIMPHYSNHIFRNKTVLLGILLAVLITATLVLTGGIAVPSVLGGVGIVLGGAAVGAAAKRFAAYQETYRFGLFKEPVQLRNEAVGKTALVAPKALGR